MTRALPAVLALTVMLLGGSTAWASTAEPSARSLAERALALRQQVPRNVDLFTSVFLPGPSEVEGFYPGGSAMAPDTRPLPTAAEARAQLRTHLRRRFPDSRARRNAGLAVYDGARAEAMIPDPLLRAALAGLTGTVLEPTIDHLLRSGRFHPARIGGLPVTVIARSSLTRGRQEIIFNRRYAGERFDYLIAVMGHEILHDDAIPGAPEESVAYALTAMTHMQLLSQLPALAYSRTELARWMNTLVLIFVNSREARSPNSEIYAPSGRGIAPGSSQSQTDLWSFAHAPDISLNRVAPSPGAGPLRKILRNALTRGTSIPRSPGFNRSTAALFARLGDRWLSDNDRAAISVLLDLVTPRQISRATGLSKRQVIRRLGLRRYLAAIN